MESLAQFALAVAIVLYLVFPDTDSTAFPPSQVFTRPSSDGSRPMMHYMMSMSRESHSHNLPEALYRLIHEFTDHDEIRCLFRILTSPEDRLRVLGFQSHREMNEQYPSKVSKVAYLKTLMRFTDGMNVDDGSAVKFDATDTFVVGILWDEFWNETQPDPERNLRDIQWSAIGGLHRLESLSLKHLDLEISMHDLALMPTSLIALDITGNTWTEPSGDVDLSLLPPKLQAFSADYCWGMNGSLRLTAPHSMLRTLDLMGNDLEGILDLRPPPPWLSNMRLSIPQPEIPVATRQFLKSQLIHLKLY